jgi:predicted RNase H-like nuclease (RuvC/YqgF family)
MNIDEIERIRTAMSINEQARYKRKGGDDMTDQERRTYTITYPDVMSLEELQNENQKLRDVITKLTNKLAAMERQLKESEKQNGTIMITADTINHVRDRVASVTFRK